jgi:hypothetical protein
MSRDPFRCGGIGELVLYHSVSQGVDGCMNAARSAAEEPLTAGGGNDIWRSVGSAECEGLVDALGKGGAGISVGASGFV